MDIRTSLCSIAAMLCLGAKQSAPDLSPANWPADQRAAIEAREAAVLPQHVREISGRSEMISATASPVAVHAGMEVLRQGGTAADAAVATSLMQVTMMLGANVSFAGTANILYYEAATGQVHVLDAGWNSWRGETDPRSIPGNDLSLVTGQISAGTVGADGRKTLVPGFMAGMEAFHQRFGKLPWRTVVAPSLYYARAGVPVTPLLSAYFNLAKPALSKTPEGRAFLMPDGQLLPAPSSRFIVPGLAVTLEDVARHGAAAMYTGNWARHFVAMVRAHGGVATMEDMAAYKPVWTRPLTLPFRGGTIYGSDEGNAAACTILMAINLAEQGGVKGRYWENARSMRRLALALRLSIVAPFSPEVAALDARLGMGGGCKGHLQPNFGATAMQELDELAATKAAPERGHHSASLVVVDRWGNIALVGHTSNTPLWGDAGMIVDGVALPLAGGIYQSRIAAVKPGQRVASDQTPLLFMRAGKPDLALSGIGVSVYAETTRLMLGLADGEDLAAWASAPSLLYNFEQMDRSLIEREEYLPEGRYSDDFQTALRAEGLKLKIVDVARTAALKGTNALVKFGPDGTPRTVEVPGVLVFGEGR